MWSSPISASTREPELEVANLEQLTASAEPVQPELGLGPAGDDYTTADGETPDERAQWVPRRVKPSHHAGSGRYGAAGRPVASVSTR